ncbi:MAG TPA: efflux RND transporter periplasmic adaptor subunit [Candidatus Methylomirabilis sp.]|nr:efflux RND transporter periplasmic adaptor subunit [Candidatus Methylomirabilis sp.]
MNQKRWIGAGGVLAVAGFLVWMWIGRSASQADATDSNSGSDATLVTAAVAPVTRATISISLKISGEFKPFQDVDVHAKVAGYIKTIYVDVGDHVKEGQTLAILEVPELAAQLAGADAAVRRAKEEIGRAQGDLQRSRSAHAAAHSAYERLNDAAKTREGLVAQQELDDAQAKDLEAEAQVSSAKSALSSAEQALAVAQASQEQVAALSDYTRITAPFAGVITNRYADTGALVAAGTSSSTQAGPVVKIAQISVLRLVLPIPESIAAQIHLGDPVKVHVQALNEDIQGKISRFADSLDVQTRTMETEIDCENRDGRLMPGMYTETVLTLQEKKDALTVPLESVVRNGTDATILAVNSQNTLEERHVKLGIEDNARVEVLSGLSEGDRVVVGNRSEFRSGQKVQPKQVSLPEGNPAGGN